MTSLFPTTTFPTFPGFTGGCFPTGWTPNAFPFFGLNNWSNACTPTWNTFAGPINFGTGYGAFPAFGWYPTPWNTGYNTGYNAWPNTGYANTGFSYSGIGAGATPVNAGYSYNPFGVFGTMSGFGTPNFGSNACTPNCGPQCLPFCGPIGQYTWPGAIGNTFGFNTGYPVTGWTGGPSGFPVNTGGNTFGLAGTCGFNVPTSISPNLPFNFAVNTGYTFGTPWTNFAGVPGSGFGIGNPFQATFPQGTVIPGFPVNTGFAFGGFPTPWGSFIPGAYTTPITNTQNFGTPGTTGNNNPFDTASSQHCGFGLKRDVA